MSDAALACFQAYDIRGRVPGEIDADLVYRVGRAYPDLLGGARRIVIGRDARATSLGLAVALGRGLAEAGVTVLDLGLCGTEEVYFGTRHEEADGGIMITASHNPKEYNGLKLVGRQARPLDEAGLPELRARLLEGRLGAVREGGSVEAADLREEYVTHLLGYIDSSALAPLTLVSDPGNGCAGLVVDRLAPSLPVEIVRVRHEPDARFPHGVPNPMLEENRAPTRNAIQAAGADLGAAWDGDFDRCFFYDADGNFIEGYYLVGLLAEALLRRHPGSRIVHDPRLTWNTRELVSAAGGEPVQSRCGHTFVKQSMRDADAVYGGEMSAHHYFRDFGYCDSGMIPLLLVLQELSQRGEPLAALVAERMARYPVSGEINTRLEDPDRALARVEERYAPGARAVDRTDGLGLAFDRWRFNLRKSNTEPLIRLNVETRADPALLEEKTLELLALLRP